MTPTPRRTYPNDEEVTEIAQSIIDAYSTQLTIRQLYYRMVAAKHIPNDQKAYKWLVGVLTRLRKSGDIDIDAFTDRERESQCHTYWEGDPESVAESIIDSIERGVHIDRWEGQPKLVRVAIEKKALVGVFERVCWDNSVRLDAFKGYPSLSYLNEIAQEVQSNQDDDDKEVIILYFGDHDPSGLDIPNASRNLMRDLFGLDLTWIRVGLNYDQTDGQVPDPAKMTDSRAPGYVAQYGDQCWELDTIEPPVLQKWCEDAIAEHFDDAIFHERQARKDDLEEEFRDLLRPKLEELGFDL